MAAELGAIVTAVDPNPEFIRRGRELNPEINWLEAGYSSDLFTDHSFDVVLSVGAGHAGGPLPAALTGVCASAADWISTVGGCVAASPLSAADVVDGAEFCASRVVRVATR